MQYLYQIAKSAGYDDIILGNLYIAGCSLDTHYNNAMYGNASYIYYKNTTGSWTETADKTMLYGIQDEDWDIITLQQASGSSGRPDTYNRLERLVGYVNSNKTNPDAKIGWHMTWAYQGDSDHWEFPNYGNSQETMYNAILSAVKQEVIPTGLFDFIIPSGTAIQNARTSYIGDTLTRDGYHLSIPYGRYIAGLTWMQALTGVRAEEISYIPDVAINSSMLEIAREAANNAIKNSFVNTKSVYTEEPQINWEDYDQLELELTPYAYYFSTNDTELYLGVGEEFNSKYIATQKFTKEQIPVGSLIVVDSGWQYRPEGWQTLENVNTSARPGNVSIETVEVTDEWWGNFTIRAFNLSKISGEDISSKADEARQHFRIYVPKNN